MSDLFVPEKQISFSLVITRYLKQSIKKCIQYIYYKKIKKKYIY